MIGRGGKDFKKWNDMPCAYGSGFPFVCQIPQITALTDLTLTGYKYKYYPWPAGSYQLIVEVKGDRDANIMFTPCNGCQGYRVLLGGWANQKSFIRDNEHDDRDQTLVETPGILSTTEFRRFYITLSTNSRYSRISVRKENEKEVFMEKSWRNDAFQ